MIMTKKMRQAVCDSFKYDHRGRLVNMSYHEVEAMWEALSHCEEAVKAGKALGHKQGKHYSAVLSFLSAEGGYRVDALVSRAVVNALATGLFVCYKGMLYASDIWE